MSDRVACDICNKEVCNKYFLKTHKIKVHGLDSGLGVDGFRDGLNLSAANENPLQDIRPLLHLDHLSQKHEDITKTFMNIAAEIGLKNAGLNELKREPKNQLDKDQLNLVSADKSTFKISSRKDSSKEDLSTAISLIAKNSYCMAQLEPGGREGRSKGTGQGNLLGSAAGDLFKHCSSGKHSGHEKSKRSWPGGKHSSKEGKGSSNKPSEEVLKKSGIDPEAYCEICKKEFCSKYFLKTHKHKTHGVKSEPSMEAKPAPSTLLQGFSVAAASAAIAQSVVAAGALTEGAADRRGSEIADNSAGQKATRESSSNGARATCEICSKTLCNKYFLKTHMLKIHGSSVDAAGCTAHGGGGGGGGGVGGGGGGGTGTGTGGGRAVAGSAGQSKPDSISAKDCVSLTDIAASSAQPLTSSEAQSETHLPSLSPSPSLLVLEPAAKDSPPPLPSDLKPKEATADDSSDRNQTEYGLRPTEDRVSQVMTAAAEDALPGSAALAANSQPQQGSPLTTDPTGGRCGGDSEAEDVREKMYWSREPDIPRLDVSDGLPSQIDDLLPPKLVREECVFDLLDRDSPPKMETWQDQSCGAAANGSQYSGVQGDTSVDVIHGVGEDNVHGTKDKASNNEPPPPPPPPPPPSSSSSSLKCTRTSSENCATATHRRRAHRKRVHASPGDNTPKDETSNKKIKRCDNEQKEATEEENGGKGRDSKDSGDQRSAEEENDRTVMDVEKDLETPPEVRKHLKDSPSTAIVASDGCVTDQFTACCVFGSTATPSSSSSVCSASSASSVSSSSSSFTSCNVYMPSSVLQIREPLTATLTCTATTSIN